MMMRSPARSHGFVAATALFAIGLFVLLGAVLTMAARNATKAKQFQETKEQIVAQRDLIANMLILCGTIYPAGKNNNGNPTRQQYPATPADGLVSSITCPGAQSPASIWSGDSRGLAPRPLPGYTAWTYVNDATSIRISTSITNAGSQYFRDLLDRVVDRIGDRASRTGDVLTITLITD